MPVPNIVMPSVTGLMATTYGQAGGTTSRYYWVQPVYPTGVGIMTSVLVSNTLASLGFDARVQLSWNPSPGAISYNVYMTTTSTPPSYGANIITLNNTEAGYADRGRSNSLVTGWLQQGGRFYARGIYNFAVDGGATGTINLAQAETIPAGAIIITSYTFVHVATVTGDSATLAFGTLNGTTTNLLGATASASLTLNAIIRGVPLSGPTPYRQATAGQITATIGTGTFTVGVVETVVEFFLPSRL